MIRPVGEWPEWIVSSGYNLITRTNCIQQEVDMFGVALLHCSQFKYRREWCLIPFPVWLLACMGQPPVKWIFFFFCEKRFVMHKEGGLIFNWETPGTVERRYCKVCMWRACRMIIPEEKKRSRIKFKRKEIIQKIGWGGVKGGFIKGSSLCKMARYLRGCTSLITFVIIRPVLWLFLF